MMELPPGVRYYGQERTVYVIAVRQHVLRVHHAEARVAVQWRHIAEASFSIAYRRLVGWGGACSDRCTGACAPRSSSRSAGRGGVPPCTGALYREKNTPH